MEKFIIINTDNANQNTDYHPGYTKAKESSNTCKISSENLLEKKSKLRCLAYNNSNKSTSNIYQHFMLHALLNFQGDNFVYDLNLT